MLALKKLYGEELLRLALMLSLLRVDPENYLRLEEARLLAGGLVNGTDWSPEISGHYHRSRTLHPKSIDSMLFDYERDVFEEMISLGRWSNNARTSREEVQAYLLSGVESVTGQQVTASVIQNSVNQDLYSSHLPVVQLDDDQVEQCVTVKTEEEDDENAQYEEGACATPQCFEREVVVKSEDVDDEPEDDVIEHDLLRQRSISLSVPPPIRNLSTFNGPLLEEDSATCSSFDVDQFFTDPPLPSVNKINVDKNATTVAVDDNAVDDFMPFYLRENGDNSIRDQNLADLMDFDETPETLEEFKRQIECFDVKEDIRRQEDFERYLLENTEIDRDANINRIYCIKRERASTSFTSVASSSGFSEDPCTSGSSTCDEFYPKISNLKKEKYENSAGASNLTQEDMDLIEVLWKQDVDMGYSLKDAENPENEKFLTDSLYSPGDRSSFDSNIDGEDEIDVLKKTFKETCDENDCKKDENTIESKSESIENDPWAGFSYTIDTETGEYILTGELPEADNFDFFLEKTLKLIELDDASTDIQGEVKNQNSTSEGEIKPNVRPEEGDMLAPRYHPHPHPHHHHHHHHHGGVAPEHHSLGPPAPQQQQQHHHAAAHHFATAYHHQNLVRSMSMEQRWQDLATLLALPAPGAPPTATLAPPSDPHHHHHHHHHHLYQQHHVNSTLGHCSQGSPSYVGSPYAPLAAEKPTLPTTPDLYGPSNIGTAVAASMNVPHTPHPCATSSGGGPPPFYKTEHPPQENHQSDPMYYQNATNELNGTSDGFLSQILNDEDLQLMDMAMNEGMYTMRMLESGGAGAAGGGNLPTHLSQTATAPTHNMSSNTNHISMGTERIDASSDSAVSSMGSERVPSLSDGEWCDAGSDSAQEFHRFSKLRTCDSESRQQPLVAQKKHQMFGKRCFQEQTNIGRLRDSDHDDQISDVKYEYEQASMPASAYMPEVGHMVPEMKYSCAMDLGTPSVGIGVGPTAGALRHNHTYSLPPAPPQPPHRPLARDKKHKKNSDTPGMTSCANQHPLTRDEKRARQLGIPLSVHDIINLPMDEFNERLSKHDLSETQLSLIRDIRRRGKNKVAAQNCRKRKLDQITSLADEVKDARLRKQRLQRERHILLTQRQRAKEHFAALYRHVFQHLRDADGNPLSSQQYSLQQAADGTVVLVPRASASLMPEPRSPRSVDRGMSSSTNGTSDDDLDRIKLKQRKSFDQ